MSRARIPLDRLQAAVDARAKHGSVPAAAAALGVPVRTLENHLQAARASPLSEDAEKFHADWTPDDCLRELRRIAEIDTTRVVTRNYFRVTSKISEATWNRYFGTFAEFKRQANITLPRHAARLEKAIARHASADTMRIVNENKRGWEDCFVRPREGRFQSAVVMSDIHDIHCDSFYRRVVLDTIKRVQPEKIVLNGDIFDLPEFSKHTQDPREYKLLDRISWVHGFLEEMRTVAPDAEIIFVEGNHEFRLLRHLGEQTPALMGILSDMHGFSVSKLLGLDRYEVNYIARADMTAWTERDIKLQLRKNYAVLWDGALLFGHYPEMRKMGVPGASGHHHKHLVWTEYSPVHGPWEWHQIGCGHQREAVYCAGEKWANGFLLAHVDTQMKRTQFEYIDTTHGHAVVGGRWYNRAPDEPILDGGENASAVA